LSRIILQPGFILHSRPYRDTSALMEVFTREYGRLGLVARGARGAKSKLRGVLQPFRPVLLSWLGHGDLGTLTDAEAQGVALTLGGRTLLSGYYLNELVQRLTHRHDPHPALYDAYQETLANLNDDGRMERVLRLFEKRLLQELGYGLVLDHDVASGAPLTATALYRYQLERGPVFSETGASHGLLLHGSSLLSLAGDELYDECSLRESKRLMRAVLALYLGDKPLKSRDLFRGMTAAPGVAVS
jgi:DNA repair protein RecO (recombination protein O)